MEINKGRIEYISNNDITALVPYNDISMYKSKAKIKMEKVLKRTIDIIGSICGIIALIPLTLIIYIANAIYKEKGPIFYSQLRIGKNGKKFRMYKPIY